MKQFTILLLLMSIVFSSFSQFDDTTQLNSFIRDTIKDKRPDRVTAAQVQKAMLGITKFLNPNAISSAGQGLRVVGNTLRAGGPFTQPVIFDGTGDLALFRVVSQNDDGSAIGALLLQNDMIFMIATDGGETTQSGIMINPLYTAISGYSTESNINQLYVMADSVFIGTQDNSVFRVSKDGYIRTVYKNNSKQDSILIVDNKGNLKQSLFSVRSQFSYDFPAINSHNFTFTTVQVPGAQVGDIVNVVPNDENGFAFSEIITAWVTAPDMIIVKVANYNNFSIDLTNRTYNVMVTKFYNSISPGD